MQSDGSDGAVDSQPELFEKEIWISKSRLKIEKNGFGALPIQRVNFDESAELVRKAYHNGINFFDTARATVILVDDERYSVDELVTLWQSKPVLKATLTISGNSAWLAAEPAESYTTAPAGSVMISRDTFKLPI